MIKFGSHRLFNKRNEIYTHTYSYTHFFRGIAGPASFGPKSSSSDELLTVMTLPPACCTAAGEYTKLARRNCSVCSQSCEWVGPPSRQARQQFVPGLPLWLSLKQPSVTQVLSSLSGNGAFAEAAPPAAPPAPRALLAAGPPCEEGPPWGAWPLPKAFKHDSQ